MYFAQQVDPETGEYICNSNEFCIPSGVDEPGELVVKISDDTMVSSYTDAKAVSKKVNTILM